MTNPDNFRIHCSMLRTLVTWVVIGLSALLLFIHVLLPLAQLLRQPDAVSGRYVLLALVCALPGVCYLWALWAVRRAFGELAAGRLFQPTVVQALRQIGCWVIVGALLSIFAVTNLSRIIVDGHGGFAYFDLSGIVLAVVGAALIQLARLLEQARGFELELDEMI